MNEPIDYLTFEERREVRKAQRTIAAMVNPTMQDAVKLVNNE